MRTSRPSETSSNSLVMTEHNRTTRDWVEICSKLIGGSKISTFEQKWTDITITVCVLIKEHIVSAVSI